MKRSSSGSQSKGNRSRKLVKNRLQIGDSRLSISTHPGNRDTVPKITRSNVGMQNFYADNTSTPRLKQVDGGTFKKEIGAKKKRAADVYGSRNKALAASYRKDKTTGEKLKSKKVAAEGGLTSKKKKTTESTKRNPKQRPRNRGLI